jgi:hypothetical protein
VRKVNQYYHLAALCNACGEAMSVPVPNTRKLPSRILDGMVALSIYHAQRSFDCFDPRCPDVTLSFHLRHLRKGGVATWNKPNSESDWNVRILDRENWEAIKELAL